MPTAQLIDINTAAITHRNGVLSGITERNYPKTIRHLKCYNSALPAQYKITIDTDEYYEKRKENIVAECMFCKAQIQQHRIKPMRLLLSPSEQFLSGRTHDIFWTCPDCKRDNKQSKTTYIQNVQKKPFYLRLVPEPPRRKGGLSSRMIFDLEFEEWASNFLEELEESAAKYRQEYRPKDQGELDESMIDLSVEEEN